MSRNPKDPPRPLLEEDRQQLLRLNRGQAAADSQVARAKAVLVVDGGIQPQHDWPISGSLIAVLVPLMIAPDR